MAERSRADTATVLFTDLVGSTELRSRLGEDGADALRHVHDELLAAVVGEHNGIVVKGLGDGILATFDSAADAIGAAVEIQQAADVHTRRSPEAPLRLRVGISIGDVVWEDGDCFGTPVVEASRLCAAADGGQILVADLVRLMTRGRGGFELHPTGELVLKGLPEAVATCEVAWTPVASTAPETTLPFPGLLHAAGEVGFSGRQVELDLLLGLAKEALTGEHRAVLLAGEPGIGKTRLAAEVAHVLHERGAMVLYGRCDEDLGVPYQPFVEALEYVIAHSPPDMLAGRLGRLPGELVRLVPALEHALPGLDGPTRSDPETERYRLFDAVASWLGASAADGGLVLVLDDLHWAGKPTLLLAYHVLRSASTDGVAVLGTYRDTDLDRTHPLSAVLADLRRLPHVERIALGGLDADGVLELMAYAAGHELEADGVALAHAVHEETEGNPFFVFEVLRHLAESGALVQEEGRWRSGRPVAEMGIPEGIREVVGRRLSRLPQDVNAVLTVAAVLGRDIDLDLLVAVGDASEDAVVDALDAASAARLVEETGAGHYRFAHALVRSTLYEELSATRRVRLHRRGAAALEAIRPGDLAGLAHHLAEAAPGGDVAAAVAANRRAGEWAMTQLANDEAIVLFERAVALLDDAEVRDPEVRCELLIGLAECTRRGGTPNHREVAEAAVEAARALGPGSFLARAALAGGRGFWSQVGTGDELRIAALEDALVALGDRDPVLRSQVLASLAFELVFASRGTEPLTVAADALAAARSTGDPTAIADALSAHILCRSLFVPTLDTGAEVDELMLLTADDPYRLFFGCSWSAMIGVRIGDRHRYDDSIVRLEAIADELRQPQLRWMATVYRGVQHLVGGDLDEADRLTELGFELGREANADDVFAWYAGTLYSVRLEQARLAELIDVMAGEVEARPGIPAWRAALAFALCELGRPDDAAVHVSWMAEHLPTLPLEISWTAGLLATVDAATRIRDVAALDGLLPLLETYTGEMSFSGVNSFGAIDRGRGLALAALGRHDEADAAFAAAAALEDRMLMPTWGARSRLDRAAALLDSGRDGAAALVDEAAALIDPALHVAVANRIAEIRARL